MKLQFCHLVSIVPQHDMSCQPEKGTLAAYLPHHAAHHRVGSGADRAIGERAAAVQLQACYGGSGAASQYVYIYVYIYICIYIYMYIFICVYMYVYIYIYADKYICIYIYIQKYICVCEYGFTSRYLQLLLCASCIPKNTLKSHARINEHMQINEDRGNISKFRGKNHLKEVKISQQHLKSMSAVKKKTVKII